MISAKMNSILVYLDKTSTNKNDCIQKLISSLCYRLVFIEKI